MTGGSAVHDRNDPSGDATTWRHVAREAEARLRAAGTPEPGMDVRRLVEQATGSEPGEYPGVLSDAVTHRRLAYFDAMLTRLLQGEPLQYVLGRWGFRRLDLMVDRRVLIPRPETESVVEHALTEIERLVRRDALDYQHRLPVVDLGTGSGAIALAIADEHKLTDVWATDLSDEALAVARANLAGLGRAAARVQLRQGSWYQALPPELAGTVGVVVANPPYVTAAEQLPAVVEAWEPALALRSGEDGLEAARTVITDAPAWLRPGGVVVVELAPAQLPAAGAIAESAGFVEHRVGRDLAGRARCIVARSAG